MTCPDRYDLKITDGEGTSYGLLLDWAKGGAGVSIEKGANVGSQTAVSTKGNFGVRDVNDHQRIIQTDWSEGCGQLTYDREADSESAFDSSYAIDVDHEGELRIGPATTAYSFTTQNPAIFSARDWVWGSFTDAGVAANRVRLTQSPGLWANAGGSPDGHPVDFATDSDGVFMVSSAGSVYDLKTGTAVLYSASTGLTHVACAAGYLYAAKGTASAAAQLGTFGGTPPVWSELTPPAGKALGTMGVTFALEASGNYVYWGITYGGVTTIYKAMYSAVAEDISFATVAVLPTGFTGTCMSSYLGTVYVGGYWDGVDATHQMGSIYALVNDTPALLTDVGDDSADNRVLSLACHGRNLYFAAANAVWRWDLVKGGYSHFAGPLSSSSLTYSSISWVGDWPMDSLPGVEGPLLDAGNPYYSGGATASASGVLNVTLPAGSYASFFTAANSSGSKTDGIASVTGTTAELTLTNQAIGLDQTGICLGIKDELHAVFVRVLAKGSYYVVTLERGNVRSEGVVLASAQTVDKRPLTVRLTLKNGVASVILNGVRVILVTLFAPTGVVGAKCIWFTAYNSGSYASYAIIDRIRWTTQGEYIEDNTSLVTVSGIGLCVYRDRLLAACTGVGTSVTDFSSYMVPGENETAPWLKSSRSAGNMPTVEKYFSALHVSHETLPGDCALTAVALVDGQAIPLHDDRHLVVDGVVTSTDDPASLSSETLTVFPIARSGKQLQWQLGLTTTSASTTPVVQEVAVVFDPTPRTAKVYTYYVRCWSDQESRTPNVDWDEDASEVGAWLEETANSIVTVETPDGTSYTGRIETLDNVEAPPSGRNGGKAGLYKLAIRRLN